MSFFSAFSYKSPVMPIIDKKVNSVTTTVYYGPKRQKYVFFHYLMKKSLLFSPYFFKSDPFSKKTHSSHAQILSKKSPFSQNTVLSCHFISLIFMNYPLLSCRRLFKNRKFPIVRSTTGGPVICVLK